MAPNGDNQPQKGPSRAWNSLEPSLAPWVLDAMASMGFTKMTPVQASTIPLFIGNKDVVVEAVTGSGKTLAFLIPVVERLLRLESPMHKHHVGAIIISPTRELATQIHSVLVSLLGFHPSSAAALGNMSGKEVEEENEPLPSDVAKQVKVLPQLLLGGTSTPAQDLSKFLTFSPNLLIGTPGRLLELVSSPHVHCPQSSFEVLVLDEADRLLDLGFKDDLQNILTRLPKQRRTGLFSASVSEAVDQLIRVGLRNPVKISVKVKSETGAVDKMTPASLQMTYVLTKPTEKLPALAQILNKLDPQPQRSIVYVSTCATVDYLQHILPLIISSFEIVPLHGKHAPNVRQRNFTRFVDSSQPVVLLTTDVAARGLDIPAVDLVVQLDPPSDPKAFIHRCGRSGRAGRKGLAVVCLCPGCEEDYIPFMAVRKTPLSKLTKPDIEVPEKEAAVMADRIRKHVLTDRAFFDKAQTAFVSWVQSYRKHQASSIFRVADLDWEQLGNGWGLLRLPSMPELKGWSGDRKLGLDIDISELKYKDKAREKRRQEEAAKYKNSSNVKHAKPASTAWSDRTERKELREVRREKRKAKREGQRLSKMSPEERKKKEELDIMIAEIRKQTALEQVEFDGFSD